MGTFRQTNTIRPTKDQFKELFDLNKNTFWEHSAYSWYDPKPLFNNNYESFRDSVINWSLQHTKIFQMYWEDDTLLGLRSFLPSELEEDYANAIIHTASDDGPIPKIIGDDPNWKDKTLKLDIMVTREDSTGSRQRWMIEQPEIAPTWNNNDGESLWQAMWQIGYERAYGCTHGKLQKQLLWQQKGCESLKHDIWLQMGYSFNERKQLGFDVNEQSSFIYRLVGGESMGWPRNHALYHKDNEQRPDKIERPYIDSIDKALEQGLEPAPIPPESID